MTIHNWIRGPAAVVGLAAFLAMSAGQAEAALVGCGGTAGGTTSLLDKVTGDGVATSVVSSCQYDDSTTQSTTASIKNINNSEFFGFDDWLAMNPVQTQVNANASSGTWDLGTPDFAVFDYLISFKDGAGTHLIAFLFDETVLTAANPDWTNGDWYTPFVDPPFNFSGASTSHDVSHYTIARRITGGGGGGGGGGGKVPEPGVLGLMGLGLLGLGLTAYARRRRVA